MLRKGHSTSVVDQIQFAFGVQREDFEDAWEHLDPPHQTNVVYGENLKGQRLLGVSAKSGASLSSELTELHGTGCIIVRKWQIRYRATRGLDGRRM